MAYWSSTGIAGLGEAVAIENKTRRQPVPGAAGAKPVAARVGALDADAAILLAALHSSNLPMCDTHAESHGWHAHLHLVGLRAPWRRR